jgi:hypothetical protein
LLFEQEAGQAVPHSSQLYRGEWEARPQFLQTRSEAQPARIPFIANDAMNGAQPENKGWIQDGWMGQLPNIFTAEQSVPTELRLLDPLLPPAAQS